MAMEKTKALSKYDTIPLAEDPRCHVSLDCKATQRNNNTLAMGGTGSGKSLSVMLPFLLHAYSTNAVAVFTKSSLMKKIQKAMEKRGYSAVKINFVHPEESDVGYDPLLQCKTNEDIEDLAQAMVFSAQAFAGKDVFWDESARQIIALILRFVWNGHYKGGRNMNAALYLLDHVHQENGMFDEKSDDMWDEDDKMAHPTHYALRNLRKIHPEDFAVWENFNDGAETTSAGIASSVRAHVAKMFNDGIRKFLKVEKQYSFEALLQPQAALFVLMSPVNAAQHNFISLFYHQAFKRLFELGELQPEGALPHPVQVICDDFATGCHVPDFDQTISIFREKGIAATMLVQSETQLVNIYGTGQAQTIINNCDTIIYLGGMDIKTCENVAKRANVPLDEVLSLPIGREIFFRRGQKPIFTKRYDILKDPVYQDEIANAR